MIRPATEAELRFIRASWARSWNPRSTDLAGGMFAWGSGRRVSSAMARRMHGALVDATATTSTSLVWAVDGGEPLSWCCRELLPPAGDKPALCLMHFCYTVKAARSKGLASALVRYVRAEADTIDVRVVETHLNGPGRGLLKKARDQDDQQRANLS